jgi:hypothetical protein
MKFVINFINIGYVLGQINSELAIPFLNKILNNFKEDCMVFFNIKIIRLDMKVLKFN